MGKRATLPPGIKAAIDPNTTNTPLVENAAFAADQIGTGVAAQNISDTDSVMPLTDIIGGKLTATATIDLMNGIDPTTGVAGVNANTRKVIAIELYVDPASTGTCNVAPGASNPYPLFGTGKDINMIPGMHIPLSQRKKSDGSPPATRLPTVSSTVKNITVTITGSVTSLYQVELGD